jgi:RNA polymerase sigma-70 factor (ECF subfamily)
MRAKGAVEAPGAGTLIACEPGSPEGDSALAEALARDLNTGFEALAYAWRQRLYAFTLRMTGSPTDAEELAQETLVRAWRALADFDTERRRALHVRSWLFQIAANLTRNHARAARRSGALSLDALDELQHANADGAGVPAAIRIPDDDPAVTPEALLERRQRLEWLAGLLLELPHTQRLALTLRHIEGMSYLEIAAAVDLPVGTVKSHASRGALALRQAIQRDQTREAYREETEMSR